MALLAQMALFSTRILTKLTILTERFFFQSAKSVNRAKSFFYMAKMAEMAKVLPLLPLSPVHFFIFWEPFLAVSDE